MVRIATGTSAKEASQQVEKQVSPLMSARTVRLLKLSIIVMTFLIAAGLIALVYGMKQQINKLAAKAPVGELVKFTLPKGAELRAIAAADEDGSVWLHLDTANGQPMLLLVNAKGNLVRTLSLK
ncbi:MAG: hypothetical protein ACJ0BX_00765 [Candidatus Puniceispirillaceae bacterium]